LDDSLNKEKLQWFGFKRHHDILLPVRLHILLSSGLKLTKKEKRIAERDDFRPFADTPQTGKIPLEDLPCLTQ
jgi:hypothetical protein